MVLSWAVRDVCIQISKYLPAACHSIFSFVGSTQQKRWKTTTELLCSGRTPSLSSSPRGRTVGCGLSASHRVRPHFLQWHFRTLHFLPVPQTEQFKVRAFFCTLPIINQKRRKRDHHRLPWYGPNFNIWISVGEVNYSCSFVGYFPAEPYTPDDQDSTTAIPCKSV